MFVKYFEDYLDKNRVKRKGIIIIAKNFLNGQMKISDIHELNIFQLIITLSSHFFLSTL